MTQILSTNIQREELGFWDTAVDAVITDKASVTNRMTQSSAKSAGSDVEKVSFGDRIVRKFVNVK